MKLIIFILGLVLLAGFVAAIDIYSCPYKLLAANTTYDVMNNLNCTADAFDIRNASITLDCHGFRINYSTSLAGNAVNISTAANNSVIKNCNFTNLRRATTLAADGIQFFVSRTNNITVYNNSFMLTTGATMAFDCQSADQCWNLNITKNKIESSGIRNIVQILFANAAANLTFQDNNVSLLSTGGTQLAVRFHAPVGNIFFDRNNFQTVVGNAFYFTGLPTGTVAPLTTYSGNTVGGLPINISQNMSNINVSRLDLDSMYGSMVYVGCVNVTVENSNISGDGISLFNARNTTIRNNNISSTSGYGLFWYNAAYLNSGITIDANYIKSSVIGMYIYESNNDNITNNIINLDSINQAIYIQNSENSMIANNFIRTTASASIGIYMVTNLYNILVQNNTVIHTGSATGTGIYDYNGNRDNRFYYNNVSAIGTTVNGFYIALANNETFLGNTILTKGTSASGGNGFNILAYPSGNYTFIDNIVNSSDALHNNEFYILNGTAGAVSFTNITIINNTRLDGSEAHIHIDATPNVTVTYQYWVTINTTFSNNTIATNTNVTILDQFNKQIYNNLSNGTGIIKTALTWYNLTKRGALAAPEIKQYWNNYTIWANRTDQNFSSSQNMSTNRYVNFIFTSAGGADPCACTGASSCTISCSDSCVYSTSVNMNQNNIYVIGNGVVRGMRYFRNYNRFYLGSYGGACLIYY